MRRVLILAAAALAGLALARQSGAHVPGASALDGVAGVVDDFGFDLTGYRLMGSRWIEAANAPVNAVLVAAMHEAERRYGIPQDLVVRLAWQESRFDVAAYNQASGATGIMQIVRRWHPSVDPADPLAAIDYGARYLRDMHARFGTWEWALKAYNWGPGNLDKLLSGAPDAKPEPLETRNYSAQILADLAEAGRAVA